MKTQKEINTTSGFKLESDLKALNDGINAKMILTVPKGAGTEFITAYITKNIDRIKSDPEGTKTEVLDALTKHIADLLTPLTGEELLLMISSDFARSTLEDYRNQALVQSDPIAALEKLMKMAEEQERPRFNPRRN
jgi:hypothetical protein